MTADSLNSDRRKAGRGPSDVASLCEPVARIVWGEPTTETASKLRWGTHGSRVVHRTKGVWYDHERGVGGGTLDLVPGATEDDRLQWLRDHGLINKAPSGPRKKRSGGRASFTIVATYDYADESGAPLFQVVRLVPKDFRQRRPNGTGGWTWRLGKTRRVLYRLPELREAVAGERLVIVVEGEKDADNLLKLGFTATCNAGGANKWRAEYNESLRDADVVIIGITMMLAARMLLRSRPRSTALRSACAPSTSIKHGPNAPLRGTSAIGLKPAARPRRCPP